MIFDVVTIFPDFFASILDHGVLKRARAGGQAEFRLHDLCDLPTIATAPWTIGRSAAGREWCSSRNHSSAPWKR